MRCLRLLILGLCLLVMLLPTGVGAADAFTSTPAKLWVDVPAGSGSATIKIYISNVSNQNRTFAVSHWYNYMVPVGDYRAIPESWITNFVPNNLELPPGGEAIINVTVNVPSGTPSDRYVTWLKVRDDPISEERPIVVIIRTGDAVPRYEYSMEPSFYTLDAVFVDEADMQSSDALKLTVKNTGAAACEYRLYVPHRFSVNGEAWRDGNIYQPIYELECADTVAEIRDIVSVPAPSIKGNTVVSEDVKSVAAYSKGDFPFELRIPSEVPSGYYEARVGVQIAEGDVDGTSIGIQYECRLLIHVSNQDEVNDTSPSRIWIPIAIIGGCIGAIGLKLMWGRIKGY